MNNNINHSKIFYDINFIERKNLSNSTNTSNILFFENLDINNLVNNNLTFIAEIIEIKEKLIKKQTINKLLKNFFDIEVLFK